MIYITAPHYAPAKHVAREMHLAPNQWKFIGKAYETKGIRRDESVIVVDTEYARVGYMENEQRELFDCLRCIGCELIEWVIV